MKQASQAPNLSLFRGELLTYKSYSLHNYKELPQIHYLSDAQLFAIDVVGRVFPFKTNSYVVNQLIDWDNVPEDPIFRLTFPQKGMLDPEQFDEIAVLLQKGAPRSEIMQTANRIRLQLNPHPAGQLEHNVPTYHGQKLPGVQHKYGQTVLFFPSQGQTCHAYCSFCFRWPQFVGMNNFKFAAKEAEQLVGYLREQQQVTDVLFTGGDPMIMRAKIFSQYIDALLQSDLYHVQNIRIGTKALSFWPYRFLTDADAEDMLAVFKRIVQAGKHLAVMAHFSHPSELETNAAREAIARIRETGAEIRTQSPLLGHINDSAEVWADMWKMQVSLGCVPYYMFVVRDTGAQHYFGVPLVKAWTIFKKAYQQVSGLGRTVRGPSMSADPGKIQVLGVTDVKGEKVIVLNMLQARNDDLVETPFFAKYDEKAIWIDDLEPAFGAEKFFFE